ncbi:hypothetical protein [Paracoccus sp. SSK6]|uniref:hypothetical protein n=1 Tax=Paracoccus sp. SSK6 TaxID=3143131 RepID=UPI00321A2D44
MPILIDIWGGDLHQRLIESKLTDDWDEVQRVTRDAVDTGLLVNVVHTDFIPPDALADEALEEILAVVRSPK